MINLHWSAGHQTFCCYFSVLKLFLSILIKTIKLWLNKHVFSDSWMVVYSLWKHKCSNKIASEIYHTKAPPQWIFMPWKHRQKPMYILGMKTVDYYFEFYDLLFFSVLQITNFSCRSFLPVLESTWTDFLS